MAKQKVTPELQQVATPKNDIFRHFINDTQTNPDPVILRESRGKGVGIYEDLFRDPQIWSTLQTRTLAVIGKEWEVIPTSDDAKDVKISEFVKQVLLGFNYDAARQTLLSGIVTGFKPSEVMWEQSEGDVWIKDIVGKSARRFSFDLEGKLRLLTMSNMISGEEVPEKKFVVFTNPSKNGSPFGDALGYPLHFPVWFKTHGIKYWMIFTEKFGSPTPLGIYPANTSEKNKTALLNIVTAFHQDTAATLSDEFELRLVEATRKGEGTYPALLAFMNAEISKVILGHSASADATPGKLGNENQAGNIRQDYIKADADNLSAGLNNTLIRWIVDFNFPDVKKYPKVWVRTEEEQDLLGLAQRDKTLVEMGVPFSKKYFNDTYGLPVPEDEEDTLVVPQAPAPLPTFAEKVTGRDILGEQSKIDTLGDNALGKVELDLSALQKIIDNSTSFSDLQRKIKKASGAIDMKEFRKTLEQAIFIANLQGRSLEDARTET